MWQHLGYWTINNDSIIVRDHAVISRLHIRQALISKYADFIKDKYPDCIIDKYPDCIIDKYPDGIISKYPDDIISKRQRQ